MSKTLTIQAAAHDMMTGKKGICAFCRDADGTLWCVLSSGHRYKVVRLWLKVDQTHYDESTFDHILLIRRHKDDDKSWYIMVDSDGETEVAASSRTLEFSCIALMVPQNTNPDIPIGLKGFYGLQGGSYLLMQDEYLAKMLCMEYELMRISYGTSSIQAVRDEDTSSKSYTNGEMDNAFEFSF